MAQIITGIFLSNNANVPCLSSSDIYPSECIYEVSFNFRDPSRTTGNNFPLPK